MSHNKLFGWCAACFIIVGGFSLSTAADAAASLSPLDTLRHRLETSKADDVMVIAHRACWQDAPENSLPAIEACIRRGVDMVEIDVQFSADGHLVILHDDTVNRMTNGAGPVNSLTLTQLKTLFLKEGQGGENAALTSHQIPTLEEALAAVRGRIFANMHAKGDTLLPTLAVVRELGMTDQILFKAEDLPQQDMAKFDGAYFMPVVKQAQGMQVQLSNYQSVHPVAFEIVYQDPAYLQQNARNIINDGHRLWVNTMWEGLAADRTDADAKTDPDAHWGYLVSQGVNMIQTDEPQALLDYLKAKKLR